MRISNQYHCLNCGELMERGKAHACNPDKILEIAAARGSVKICDQCGQSLSYPGIHTCTPFAKAAALVAKAGWPTPPKPVPPFEPVAKGVVLPRGREKPFNWDEIMDKTMKPTPRAAAAEQAPGEAVNHPSHYQTEDGIECIDAIKACLTPEEFAGFAKGNSLKYLWRAGKKFGKSTTLQDFKKAKWYIEKLLEK